MAKKFKITETQYKQMLDEGVAVIQGSVNPSTGRADTQATSDNLTKSGIDPKKVKVEFQGTAMSGGDTTGATVTEHRLVTKKELQSNRLRYLKENSEILPFNQFIKNLH